MKFLVPFLFLIVGTTPLFAQTDYAKDTLNYNEGVYVYDIDFFGLERTLNWHTIYQNSQLNEVILKFHNNTNTPIEIKKIAHDAQVILWETSLEKTTIPPNGIFEVAVAYHFSHGNFQSNFTIKYKHLKKKQVLTIQTFGFADGSINSFNVNKEKHGKWIDFNADGFVKELWMYENGERLNHVRYFYYPTGKIRLKMDLYKHLDTYYLETGEVEFEMRPDSRIDYYLTGGVKSIETKENVITYDVNGEQIRSRKQYLSKVLNEYQMVLEESFYPNGNLQKQIFANGKQFYYSAQIAGCITQLVDGDEGPFQRILDYENCELAAITTSSINNINGTGKKPHSISKGDFKNEKLVNGRVEQCNAEGELCFTEEIKNSRPTKAIWLNGVKYNATDASGRKQGEWISNRSHWSDWRNNFSTEILIKGYYQKGVQRDTVFYYYPGGKLKSISIKTFNIKSPSAISYYESGNIADISYSFFQAKKYRLYRFEKYADTPNAELNSVNLNGYEYVYKNGSIISRKSPTRSVDNAVSLPGKNRDQYTLATGTFIKGQLYKGKITYNNEQDVLLKTVRVADGKINGDRILTFEDPAFEKDLLDRESKVDIDRNGYITRSEIANLKKLEIKGKWIESVVDLNQFKRLEELYVNGRKVKSELLLRPVELLKEVQRLAQLPKTSKGGGGWGGGIGWPIEPDPVPEPPPQIYDIPDVDPEFPGGIEALQKFITKNLVYPELDSIAGEQGIVYVEFVVHKDGSLDRVKVLKGVSNSLDAEAKRIIKSMPNWLPGEQGGRKVSTRFVLPIIFRF